MPSPLIQYLGTERIPRPARRVRGVRRSRRMLPRFRRGYRSARKYNLYHFKRTLYLQDIIGLNTTVNYSNHFGFTLAQLPDASNFTGLYDEYRINKVVFQIIPKWSESSLNTSAVNASMQQIHTAIDYDDSLALPTATGLNEITQYQSHKFTRGNQIHTRVIVPKLEMATAGALAGQSPKARQWLDCDNTTVLHNGVKVFATKLIGSAGFEQYFDVRITTYMSFRNVV